MRDWNLFWRSFTIPDSWEVVLHRINTNTEYYQGNYLIVFIFALLVEALTNVTLSSWKICIFVLAHVIFKQRSLHSKLSTGNLRLELWLLMILECIDCIANEFTTGAIVTPYIPLTYQQVNPKPSPQLVKVVNPKKLKSNGKIFVARPRI